MACRDLGVHIDGFIAVQATTIIVGSSEQDPVTGRSADVVACAQTCFDAAVRLIRPGNRVSDVSGPLNAIAECFQCTLVEGVMTHNMKQFVIDGNKCVLNRTSAEQRVEESVFEENEVYAIDVVVSTGKRIEQVSVDGILSAICTLKLVCAGEGKAKVLNEKQTAVFKRALNVEYSLKLKASRAILSDVDKRYPCMPFPLRKLLASSTSSKFGLVECLQHGLLHAYPVLWEKEGELVAHIKGTVLLMPNGSDQVTSTARPLCVTDKSVQV